MLKQMVNEARFSLVIKTTGPLLVRSGQASITGPDMTPVRTFRDGEWKVYIPGSSLKGVVRSHSEKMLRSIGGRQCCNPFEDDYCGKKFQARNQALKRQGNKLSAETGYARACPICRLFGSTEFIGRISIGDAYLEGASRIETRDGVGIDRLTGGPKSGAKFDLEAVSSGTVFRSEVLLRNYECWQLGLLLAVVQDIEDGLVRIGGGRSRGFGAVTARVENLKLYDLRPAVDANGFIRGLGVLLAPAYGTFADDQLHAPAINWQRSGLRQVADIPGDLLNQLRESAIADLVTRLDHWPEVAEKFEREMADA